MSGIYIKGMEMPTHCIDCPFMVSRDNDDCILQRDEANENFENWEQMKAGCPLIPVPDHGRLIDADALYEKFLRLESESMSALRTTSVGSVDEIKWSVILTERTCYKFDIVDAPTIIPASGGSENE